jgi:hypothetical protein
MPSNQTPRRGDEAAIPAALVPATIACASASASASTDGRLEEIIRDLSAEYDRIHGAGAVRRMIAERLVGDIDRYYSGSQEITDEEYERHHKPRLGRLERELWDMSSRDE